MTNAIDSDNKFLSSLSSHLVSCFLLANLANSSPPYKLQRVTKCRSAVGATGGELVEVVEGKVVAAGLHLTQDGECVFRAWWGCRMLAMICSRGLLGEV